MGEYTYTPEYNAAAADVFRIRTNLRAFRHSTNPFTIYVRTEEGPMDLSTASNLQAIVINGDWPWGWADYQLGNPGWFPIVQVDAYSPQPGRVMFTLTQDNMVRLCGGLHTLFVRADNRTIYTALLEVVR
jgi:hypothetical protein